MIYLSSFQKRVIEWPLIVLLLWLFRSFELWAFQVPWIGVEIQLTPIILAYLAFHFRFTSLIYIGYIILFLTSFSIGYSKGIYIFSNMFTLMVLKVYVQAFAFDAKLDFILLSAYFLALSKFTCWILLMFVMEVIPFFTLAYDIIFGALFTVLVAWLLHPFLERWFRFFEYDERGLAGYGDKLC